MRLTNANEPDRTIMIYQVVTSPVSETFQRSGNRETFDGLTERQFWKRLSGDRKSIVLENISRSWTNCHRMETRKWSQASTERNAGHGTVVF